MASPHRIRRRARLDIETIRRLAILIFLAGFASLAAAQQPEPPFLIHSVGGAAGPLDGGWQFHPGDDPAWASPTLDDSSWATIEAGRPWEGQGFPNHIGYAWYRRHIVVPPAEGGWNLALFLPAVEDSAEIYWNGRRVGAYGKLPPHPVWYGASAPTRKGLLPCPDCARGRFILGPAQSGILAIRVWKAPYVFFSFPDEGGLIGMPQIGSADAIAAQAGDTSFSWLQGSLYQLALALLAAMVSLLALLAWLRDRRQWMLFWLAVYTVHPLALLPIIGIPGLLTFHWSYGLIAPVIAIEDVSLWFLLLYLLGLRGHPRLLQWTRIMAIVAIVFNCLDASLQLFDWTRWPNRVFLFLDVTFTIPALLIEAYGVVIVIFAFRKRLDAARWCLAIAALLADLTQAMSNWFGLGVRWTHWTIYEKVIAPLFTIGGNAFDALTLANTLLLVAIVYAVWHYETEQGRRRGALEQQFRSAQELQRVLIPESLPDIPGYAVTSAYRPAQDVGGDFFQIVALPNRAALVVIGDVSGKGLHAAMTVALIVGAIRSSVEATDQPAAILAALNRRLYGRLQSGFATCQVLRLDTDGNAAIANAGHLPPFLDAEELTLPPALPLGLTPDAEYEEVTIRIPAGSCLTLYTDGLLEARDGDGQLFGFKRTREVCGQSAAAIADVAQQFGQDDDITVLTLSFAHSEVASV